MPQSASVPLNPAEILAREIVPTTSSGRLVALLLGKVVQRDAELRQLVKRCGLEARLSTRAEAQQLRQAGSCFVVLLGIDETLRTDAAGQIRRLRSSGVDAPILLVCTGAVGDAVLEAIDAGASDFIQRTALIAELGARLQLLATRAIRRSVDRCIRIADLEIDREDRVVRRHDATVVMTNREFRILERLIESVGEPVCREDIKQRVWGCRARNGGRSNLIDVYITYIRKKLSMLGYGSAVRTLRGVGYTIMFAPEHVCEPSPLDVLRSSSAAGADGGRGPRRRMLGGPHH